MPVREPVDSGNPPHRDGCQHPLHNSEPSVVTWNYENIRRVVIWLQDFPLSYLVEPLERLKYIKDLVQIHLTFEEIGPKM